MAASALDSHDFGQIPGFMPELGFGLQKAPLTMVVPDPLDEPGGEALLAALRYLARMGVPVTLYTPRDDAPLQKRVEGLMADGLLPGVSLAARIAPPPEDQGPLWWILESVKWRYPHQHIVAVSRNAFSGPDGAVVPLITGETLETVADAAGFAPAVRRELSSTLAEMAPHHQRELRRLQVVAPEEIVPGLFTQNRVGTLISRLAPRCAECTPSDVRMLRALADHQLLLPFPEAEDMAELAAVHDSFIKAVVDDARVPAGCLRVDRTAGREPVAVVGSLAMAERYAGAEMAAALLRAAEGLGRAHNCQSIICPAGSEPLTTVLTERLGYAPLPPDSVPGGMSGTVYGKSLVEARAVI